MAKSRSGSEVSAADARRIGRSCSVFALRRATRAITQLYDDALRPVGLRATQFSVLAVVRAFEPAPQKELARLAQMDGTTMTRALKPLEREGLVRIQPGATDRRQRVVSLTPKGRRRLAKAHALWEGAQAQLMDRFGEDPTRDLVRSLHDAARAARK